VAGNNTLFNTYYNSPNGIGMGDKLTPSGISQTYGSNEKQFPISQLFPTAKHKMNLGRSGGDLMHRFLI